MSNRRLLDVHHNLQSSKLIETVKSTKPIGIIEFDLPARKDNTSRHVKQAVYVSKVRLSPPDRKRKTTRYQIFETQVVIASEIETPPNQTPVEWILLTNVPIDEPGMGHEIIKWYLCRWQIEIYFRILKSGCKIEKLQLETKTRFDTCLTLYLIIAWRILYLTMLSRKYPEMPCNRVFSQEEWEVAYMMKHKQSPPEDPIPLASMLNLIAQFGGYLNRSTDKEPGPTAVWIGLQRLRDFIKARNVFDEINKKTYG